MAEPPKPAAAKAPAKMAATPWEAELPSLLKKEFGDRIIEAATYLGQNFLVVNSESVIEVLEYLKLEVDFDFMADLTAVHYPKDEQQFEIVYSLYSFPRNERLRVKTRVKDGEHAPTATGVHLGANWLEREVFDMFGIEFAGHPDMRRLLMPDEWTGFPLRKDYNILGMDNRWVQENLGIESGQ
jgi:NADH-quinone oxidoreductase subunit C